jgi:hypothetical protein
VTAARRPAAVVRLRKCTGLDSGSQPLTSQAQQRFREKLKTPGLIGPAKAQVEKNLENTQAYITGTGLLLEKYKLTGYEDAFAKLKEQSRFRIAPPLSGWHRRARRRRTSMVSRA